MLILNQGTRAPLARARAWAHNQGRTLRIKACKWTIMKRLYAPAMICALNVDPPWQFKLGKKRQIWQIDVVQHCLHIDKYQIILHSYCVTAGELSFTAPPRRYNGKSFVDLSIKSDLNPRHTTMTILGCKDPNLRCWHFLPHTSSPSRHSPWGLQTLFLLLLFISGRLSAPTVLLRTGTPFWRPNRLPKWFCLCPFVSLLFNQQRADCNLANQVSGFIKRVTIGCEDWQGRSFISEELPGLIESGWTEQGWSLRRTAGVSKWRLGTYV